MGIYFLNYYLNFEFVVCEGVMTYLPVYCEVAISLVRL